MAAAPAVLISVDPTFGGPLSSWDSSPSVSGDGNIVVFTASPAPGLEFATDQVFVRNRGTGVTTGIPTAFPAILTSTRGVLSRDGCHVAFWGYADQVTTIIFIPFIGPITIVISPNQWDVYTWNRCVAGSAPVAVSTAADFPLLTNSGDQVGPLAISADGRYVAYVALPISVGSRVARIDTNATATEARLSNSPGGPNSIDISDDGTFIAMDGQVTISDTTQNVVTGWTPPCSTGGAAVLCNTELVSLDNGGQFLTGVNSNPSVSADGRYVAFSSDTPDLVGFPGGTPTSQVYVRDRAAKVTKLVTDTPGTPMDGRVDEPEISPDGTQIALQRRAPDTAPVAGDIAEVYVARSTSGYFDAAAFDLVSYGVNGAPTSQDSTVPSMSSNGRYVAFASFANDELSGVEMPIGQEVWLRDRPIAIDITPSIDFGTVDVGGQSAPKNAVITNTSGVAINIGSVTPPSVPFSITANTCVGLLQPGATCVVTMVFSPTVAGSASSSLNISGDGLSVTAALVGSGRAPNVPTPGSLTITPASANYGTATVGSSLPAKKFVVSNPGQTAVTFAGVGVSGAGAGQFTLGTNGCTGSLAGGASCTIEVGATVTKVGAMSATLGALGAGGQSAQAILRVKGSTVTIVLFNPTLKMNPGVVSPGQITAAVGSDFPPNIDVELAFTGEAPFATVHTDATGAFRFDYLLLRNGVRIGGREVVAIDQAQFSGVRAPLLIGLGTFRPSGFGSPAGSSGVRSLVSRGG